MKKLIIIVFVIACYTLVGCKKKTASPYSKYDTVCVEGVVMSIATGNVKTRHGVDIILLEALHSGNEIYVKLEDIEICH